MARSAPTGFAGLPVVNFPDDYPLVMPTFLAEAAQRYGPIFTRRGYSQWQAMMGTPPVYMVGPEANRFVMHEQRESFSHDMGWTPVLGGVFEKGLLNTDDPEHARQRKMMNPAFAIAYMARYLPIMNRIIEERTRDWVARGTVDIYAEARKITFDVAAETLVGFHTGAAVDRLRELFYGLMYGDIDENQDDEALMQSFRETQDELNGMLVQMIAERRRAPTDDILGILAQARDEDGAAFSDQQLLGQLHILLVAGHETSTILSSWLLYLLATNPEHRARVREEIDAVLAATDGAITLDAVKAMRLLGYVVNEAGRLYSPVGNVPRGTIEPFTFNGHTIPAGARVLVSLAGCHRLPQIFAEPNRFDPDRYAPPREEDKRTPYALVPFGGGPRICIGINFAQVEVKALAAHVLRQVDLTPALDHPPAHVYYGVTASLPEGMPMHVNSTGG
jgi:retinoid hydroxylase